MPSNRLQITARLAVLLLLLAAPAPAAAANIPAGSEAADYLIGPGDSLQVFVWKNPELSVDVPVRPDGKITTPLAPDIPAQGKTPTEVAAVIRERLAQYVQDPVVTVLVKSFAAPTNAAAIRVIGAGATPKIVSYRAGITVLDVVIETGGLDIFADGDGAMLIRRENGAYKTYPLKLKRLVKAGDLGANIDLQPGDIIRIPERWF